MTKMTIYDDIDIRRAKEIAFRNGFITAVMIFVTGLVVGWLYTII